MGSSRDPCPLNLAQARALSGSFPKAVGFLRHPVVYLQPVAAQITLSPSQLGWEGNP